MTKKNFVNLMENLFKKYNDNEKFYDDFDSVLGAGASERIVELNSINLVIEAIACGFDNPKIALEALDYLIWECEWVFEFYNSGTFYENGEHPNIDSFEDLYDEIIKE